MKRVLLAVLILAGCASGPETTTQEATEKLSNKYGGMVGKATKQDFVSDLGNAEWCKLEPTGVELCRFRKKLGTKWVGEGLDKKSIDRFDEVIAEFDGNGMLRKLDTSAQR